MTAIRSTVRAAVAVGADLALPAAQTRWPGFAAAAVEHGVRAVFAFPLLADGACRGALGDRLWAGSRTQPSPRGSTEVMWIT